MARMHLMKKIRNIFFQPACAGSGKEGRPWPGCGSGIARDRKPRQRRLPGWWKPLSQGPLPAVLTRNCFMLNVAAAALLCCGKTDARPDCLTRPALTRWSLTLPAYWLQMPARHAAGKMNIRSGFSGLPKDRLRICPQGLATPDSRR